MTEAAPARHCYACGYDLRGSMTGTCPECGRSAPVVLAIHDPEDFHHARAALEQENLIVRAIQPGGSIGTIAIVYGSAHTGWLWVDQNDLERAEELLDEMNITAHINSQRPIVDRSEPFCPKCNAKLDLFGRPQCDACGTLFDWVEIDVPQIDPTQLTCIECGYELTGSNGDRCPECNCPIETLNRVVDTALSDRTKRTAELQPPTSPNEYTQRNLWSRLFRLFVLLAVISTFLATYFSTNQSYRYAALVAAGMMLGSLVGAVICGGLAIATKSNNDSPR